MSDNRISASAQALLEVMMMHDAGEGCWAATSTLGELTVVNGRKLKARNTVLKYQLELFTAGMITRLGTRMVHGKTLSWWSTPMTKNEHYIHKSVKTDQTNGQMERNKHRERSGNEIGRRLRAGENGIHKGVKDAAKHMSMRSTEEQIKAWGERKADYADLSPDALAHLRTMFGYNMNGSSSNGNGRRK